MSSFLVVSLNPTFQQIMGYDRVRTGQVNRTSRARSEFSGKGLNVARTLARLGNSAVLLTHMNPSRIEELKNQAAAEGFRVLPVEDSSPIRTCVTVLQNGARGAGVTTTELVQESPAIEGKDTEAAVLSAFNEAVSSVDCVIITGTRSPGYSRDLYPRMAALAKKAGCRVILDVKKNDLTGSLALGPASLPDVVKPNLEELIQTYGASTDPLSLVEGIPCCAVITNGTKGCFIHQPGQELVHLDALRVKARNTTGCGDAFTAAMADSLMRGATLVEACQAGTRAGALKAQEEPF